MQKIGITKADQLKKFKEPKFNYNKYAKWIHSNNKTCIVCGGPNIEIHHITDISKIDGPRRSDKRVVPLCKDHHKDSKDGIHILSKEEFYKRIMGLGPLLIRSKSLLKEYEDQL